MASTSASTTTSSSSSSPLSFKGLFSCCLDWFSVSPSVESDSMASTSDSSGYIPENEAMSPFQGMAPSAFSMGRSSALIQKPFYNVFINHRGPDVKETLASKIYDMLVDMKVTAFLDSKELECGDFLPTTLETTIRSATLHIAIFSKRYAESTWCLEELSLMLKSGAKIIPVFYHVDPTDLRYVAQSNKRKFDAAFNEHVQKGRYDPEKLKNWKDALYKVSFYTGEIIKNNDDEIRALKNIVNIVLKEISNVPLEVAKHPVGLDELVKDFKNTVQLVDGDHGVQIVGIWGMGGSGKTTLAKELYNKISSSMEKSSFIYDIRDAKDVLYKKQIQLLKEFGVIETFDSVNQGKAIIGRHLRAFKVLIVMDDVDHVDQLDALLPATCNLGRDSLIIVTTREQQVLTSWGISSVYKMRGLDQPYAEQLFCWHAFLKPCPLNGFEELVKNFIDICSGLPLSLKVFGAELYGKFSKDFWKSMFHKISRILPRDIKERLKISYDSLDDEEKEAFLDCACFFITREHSVAIEVWNGSEWSGLYIWDKLFNKCLVELDNDNCIRMHDHLRDLGREIAKQHSPSRLWSSQQIINYGKEMESIKDIRGMVVPNKKDEQFSYREALIPCLAELKLLVIQGDYFNQIMSEVSIEPLWLCLSDIGQRSLPPRLSLKNLRVLEISEWSCETQLEELWDSESDAPVQLRELVISPCTKLQRLPNSIGCLSELKKIVITSTYNIRSLPESFCRLRQLEHLEFSWCGMLSSLPSRFGDLTNLRYLDLSFCRHLKNLPLSFRNLSLLQHLNLKYCSELILEPDDFQNITMLEFLSFRKCGQLEELPRDMINQVSLKQLYLRNVERLREIPIEIGQLRRLQELSIGSDLLISLPASLGDLSLLTHLRIEECPKLESLPTSLGALSSLTMLEINGCPKLDSLPTSLGALSSLTGLQICRCPKLESLPTSLGALSSLTWLQICRCPKLESLPTSLGTLSSLTMLAIISCPNITRLPFSVGCLSLLQQLRIDECPIIKVDFDMASSSSTSSNLRSVKIERTKVCRISICTDRYPRLERLELFNNDHLTEVEAVPVSLECLRIWGSPELVVLPSFARLTSLRELQVRDCEKIKGLKPYTGLEKLSVESSGEMLGIESLEQMQNLRRLELTANKASSIVSCIQTMKRWPDQITVCTRAVPDASSLILDSAILSPDLFVVDQMKSLQLNFYTSEFTFSEEMISLLKNSSTNGNAVMLCFVINYALSSPVQIDLIRDSTYAEISSVFVSEGRWAVIGVFTGRCTWLSTTVSMGLSATSVNVRHVELERSLAVGGEEQRLVEAFLPLFQSISN